MFFFKQLKISDFNFPKSIEINSNIFIIEVILVKKKNSSVRVNKNKLIFRISSYMSKSNINKYFNNLLFKIKLKLEKLSENSLNLNFNLTFEKILENGFFIFANRKFYLKVSNDFKKIRLKGDIFYINPSLVKDIDLEIFEKIVSRFFIKLYFNLLLNYVENLNSKTYNFKINDFEIKNLKSKWGHCTSLNSILINLKLLNTKKEILDYVIIHELCHIKHKNHSKEFWLEVSKFCNNYKKLRMELKENPPIIFKIN